VYKAKDRKMKAKLGRFFVFSVPRLLQSGAEKRYIQLPGERLSNVSRPE
jgi:hypothetical protein